VRITVGNLCVHMTYIFRALINSLSVSESKVLGILNIRILHSIKRPIKTRAISLDDSLLSSDVGRDRKILNVNA